MFHSPWTRGDALFDIVN